MCESITIYLKYDVTTREIMLKMYKSFPKQTGRK